jgi:pyrroline-5-carboxylate reductase
MAHMQRTAQLAVIGVGSIAEAIVTGLCAADPDVTVVLSPRGAVRSARLAGRHAGVWVAPVNQTAVDAADTVLLALRAADAPAVLGELTFGPDQRLISVMPTPKLDELRTLVGPMAELSRAIPAVSVARRAGLTPVFPAGSAAESMVEQLGSALVVDSEPVLDATSVASATVAAHFAYLTTIADWVTRQGLPAEDARRVVGAVFTGVSADLAEPAGFDELARQHATPGGQNERLLAAVRAAGIYATIDRELGRLLDEDAATS